MRRERGVRALVLVLLVLTCGGILWRLPMNLGLDLKGGVHVVLQAKPERGERVTPEVMDRALAVVERRVNGLGVSEAVVQKAGGDRIIVEIPGERDPRRAVELIGKTARLEFRDPEGNTVLTGADLVDARLSTDSFGRPAVALTFSSQGGRAFEELTRRWVGQQIPIVLDGEVLSAPVVNEPISGGKAEITGSFTIQSARELAVLLKAGALPVPLDVLEVRNVGPTLGRESIDRSVRAAVVGVALVVLYMILYYRLPGGVADLALVVYGLLVAALLAGLRATLTLPGLAGLVLSVGMAVDANVIIFERIREGLRQGKSLRAAVEAGFRRSFTTILDSNLTTLITAGILFFLGTGPVKGFAITLTLGILASMFTAIVVTRWLLQMSIDRSPERVARQFGVRREVA